MAGKVLLLLGLGAAALVLGSGSAHASGASTNPTHPPGQPFDVNNPPKEVKDLILQAMASANPALMRSTAQHLDDLGYHPQATALRAAADAVDAAQKAVPPNPTPGQPIPVPVPGGGTIVLPPVVVPVVAPSGANPLAASLTAQLNLADPVHNGINASPKDLVVKFQAQEKAAGKYTGALDGLYGAGTALGVASYNVVPYPPFIWSKNKQTTAKNKAAFKKAMQAKAAADPTRADEWLQVATIAQNT
jgi:hypothetical protein